MALGKNNLNTTGTIKQEDDQFIVCQKMMLQSMLKSNIIYSHPRMFVENSFVWFKNFGRSMFQLKK